MPVFVYTGTNFMYVFVYTGTHFMYVFVHAGTLFVCVCVYRYVFVYYSSKHLHTYTMPLSYTVISLAVG